MHRQGPWIVGLRLLVPHCLSVQRRVCPKLRNTAKQRYDINIHMSTVRRSSRAFYIQKLNVPPKGALGVGSSIPICCNFASVCTPRIATRPTNVEARRNMVQDTGTGSTRHSSTPRLIAPIARATCRSRTEEPLRDKVGVMMTNLWQY